MKYKSKTNKVSYHKHFIAVIFIANLIIIPAILLQLFNNPQPYSAKAVEMEIQENIRYGTEAKQVLDLCKPVATPNKAPGVILLHGGSGDKSDFRNACRDFATAGYVAVSINYREEPAPSYQYMLSDVDLALTWLRDLPYVDTTRIGSFGGSLGGYLASVVGTFDELNKVQCVVNNFGPTDFTDPNLQNSPLAADFTASFFGGVTIEQDPDLYSNLSPRSHVSSNDAASWFFTRSVNDTLVPRSQMVRMVDELKSKGIKTQVYEYNGTGGGHANRMDLTEASKLQNMRVDFMKSCLSGSNAGPVVSITGTKPTVSPKPNTAVTPATRRFKLPLKKIINFFRR